MEILADRSRASWGSGLRRREWGGFRDRWTGDRLFSHSNPRKLIFAPGECLLEGLGHLPSNLKKPEQRSIGDDTGRT